MIRVSKATARNFGIEEVRAHKYRARAQIICGCGVLYDGGSDAVACPICKAPRKAGTWFPSKKQALRFKELLQLEKCHEIRNLEREVTIGLVGAQNSPLLTERGRPITARIDAVYFQGNTRVFEDTKGKDLRLSELKRAVLRAMFPTAKIIIV